jgi:hypothetical protein
MQWEIEWMITFLAIVAILILTIFFAKLLVLFVLPWWFLALLLLASVIWAITGTSKS